MEPRWWTMIRDLGGRIWVSAEFYLRGIDAERFRRIAASRGVEADDELVEDLLLERLEELDGERETT